MGIEDRPGEPSIEEIEQAQREHEAKTAREDEEAEANRIAEEQQRASVGTDYPERLEKLAELRDVDKERKLAESEDIKNRIAQADQLKGSIRDREDALQGLQGELDGARGRMERLEALVAGKDPKMIADVTQKGIDDARAAYATLDAQSRGLISEIGQIQNRIVTDDEVKKYQDALSQIDGLSSRIEEIESNPAMVDRLESEAINENEMREEIVREVLRECSRGSGYSKEKEAYLSELTQTFITESLEARGRTRNEEPGALYNWKRSVLTGLKEQFPERHIHSSSHAPGLLLRSLVGKFGTLSMSLTEMSNVEGGAPDQAVAKYLKTLNLIKCYDENIDDRFRNRVLGDTARTWNGLNRSTELGGRFQNRDGAPFIRDDADPVLKKEMAELYERSKTKIAEINAKLDTETKEADKVRLEKIDEEIENLRKLREELVELQKIKSQADHDREMTQGRLNRDDIQTRMRRRDDERNTLGPLSFRRRGQIDRQIRGLRSNYKNIDEAIKAREAVRVGEEEGLRRASEIVREYGDIAQIDQRIRDLEQEKVRMLQKS